MFRAFLAGLLLSAAAIAQAPLPHHSVEFQVDSGEVDNRGTERAVTFSETVRVEGATWLRLYFSEARLGQVAGQLDATVLRITSLADGAVQEHTRASLQQWQGSSAFFNGDAVQVELIADPAAPASRVRIDEVTVGEPDLFGPGQKSICGATDDRLLSTDARVARIVPVGCTAWLIDDAEGCFLTAGHCVGAGLNVIEFNVPLSNADGSVNHPPPSDQYAIDQGSLQWDQTVIGNDWAYLGAFPNTETELTPIEVQGVSYTLGTPPATAGGESIRITGFGSTTGTQGTPLTWDQVLTTHSGPLTSASGTVLQYATDTTGGDSGSAILNEDNGTAIGIHTNAGCSVGGGANNGMSLSNANVQNALAVPQGVCAAGAPPLRVSLTSTLGSPASPDGFPVQIAVTDRVGTPAAATSASLIYDIGGGEQSMAMSDLGGGLWQATLPAQTCGDEVLLRAEVEAAGGATVRLPFSAESSADRTYRRRLASSFLAAFRDDFETDQGWTVDNDGSLSAGSWERGVPSGYGLREDPPWDADSSGQAFLTAAPGGNTDVDGGATRLLSPLMDGTLGADPHLTYWRWWSDAGASDDTFLVELSNDDGANWVTLEALTSGTPSGWQRLVLRVADFVAPTDQLRLRFTAADVGEPDIIEAAVDGVALWDTAIGWACDGEIFSDGFESGDVLDWSASQG